MSKKKNGANKRKTAGKKSPSLRPPIASTPSGPGGPSPSPSGPGGPSHPPSTQRPRLALSDDILPLALMETAQHDLPLSSAEDALPPSTAPVSIEVSPHPVDDPDLDRTFFDGEPEAVARLHAQELHDASRSLELEGPRIVVTPEMLARRKRLRRVVSAVVGFAAIMSALVGVRAVSASKRTVHVDPPAILVAPDPAPVPAPVPELTAEIAPTPIPDPPPPTLKTDPTQAKSLTAKSLRALESGRMPAAIEAAQASVEADPTDANPYLYWGTALLETGKSAAAKAVFSRCVENATHGPKNECRQFR